MGNRDRKVCRYCGLEVDYSVNKCENCGASKFESLRAAANHQEQFRQFNEQRANQQYNNQQYNNQPYNNQPYNNQPYNNQPYNNRTYGNQKVSHKSAYSAVGFVAIIILAFIIWVIVLSVTRAFDVSTSAHSINSKITTDWFEMTVYEGKIVRTNRAYCGLEPPSSGYERILVDIELYNYLYDENLDINIAEDFYLEAGSTKYRSLNTGGSYSIFDKLSTDGMFFGQFMVSPHKRLHGYIAFDVPLPVNNLKFVYEEYNFEGDTRTDIKKRYKVDLEYETPQIPAGAAQTFYDNALEAGYILEIINDYDGFNTFWVGAHKYVDESATKGLLVKPEPIYWIDCTQDKTESNAKVEYNNYVNKVKANGGIATTDSGYKNGEYFQYQFNENQSTQRFGIAYQIGKLNYLVESAPISEMDEILAFIESALNLNVKT